MSLTEELRQIWNVAENNYKIEYTENINKEENEKQYINDKKVLVNNIHVFFTVDDNDIYYSCPHKALDDLVYVKKHPLGHEVPEVLLSFEEFEERVLEVIGD